MPTLTLDPLDGSLALRLDWPDGYQVRPAPTGLKLPPRELRGQPLVHGGESHAGTRVGPREVMIPLDVWADDRSTYLIRERRLFAILHREGPIRLAYTEDDGVTHTIDCHYKAGVEGAGGPEMAAGVYGVLLRCPDPYWRGADIEQEWTPPVQAGSFFPVFPLLLGPSAVAGRETVTNWGSVPTYGVWTLTGPSDGIVLVNVTSGRRLELSTVLAAGEQRIVTMHPGRQSVRDAYGSSMFGEVVGSPVMWALERGPNVVEVSMLGASEISRVAVTFPELHAAV